GGRVDDGHRADDAQHRDHDHESSRPHPLAPHGTPARARITITGHRRAISARRRRRRWIAPRGRADDPGAVVDSAGGSKQDHRQSSLCRKGPSCMATVITDECINCGACEPECPNTAIYQGGVEWELNGVTHPAISNDIFYIVPEKCTECVGFFDHEACAAVCPVDCCVPDPNIPETEDVLIARAKTLH